MYKNLYSTCDVQGSLQRPASVLLNTQNTKISAGVISILIHANGKNTVFNFSLMNHE